MCIGRLPLPERSRLVADALKDSINELRKEDETRISRYVPRNPGAAHINVMGPRITTAFQGELSTFREGEEKRLTQSVFLQTSGMYYSV